MKASLSLFGQFTITYNVCAALHELGHALGNALSGGRTSFISLNPFCWSRIGFASNPRPLISMWSGVGFGLLFGLLPALGFVAFRRRVPSLLHLLGIVSLATNGIYLFGSTLAGVGDGAVLMRLGMPKAPLLIGGLLLVLGAAYWFILVMPRFGMAHSSSFASRFGILLGGVGSYLVIMMLYVAVYHRSEFVAFVVFAGMGVAMLIALGGAPTLARRALVSRYGDASVSSPRWAHVLGYMVAGVLIVSVELAVFGL